MQLASINLVPKSIKMIGRLRIDERVMSNNFSMDKLYDLMTMAFKYQLQLCTGPDQLLFISLNHLDNVRKVLPDDENMHNMIDTAHNMVSFL